MTQAPPTVTLENLSRLASKPGVQATMVLSIANGAIIQSTGLSYSPQQVAIAEDAKSVAAKENDSQQESKRLVDDSATYSGTQSLADKPAEDIAKLIFDFTSGAGALVENLDHGNDIQLLRLRTRKNEIVIVPETRDIFWL